MIAALMAVSLTLAAPAQGTASSADERAVSEAPRARVSAASGGDDHLWFVIRRGSLAAELGHVASTMADGEYRRGLPLATPPEAIAAWGAQASLLIPPRTALLPRHHLLSTSARRNPATGLWISAPVDRFELRPPLPLDAPVESIGATVDGPFLLFTGDHRLWRLRLESWSSIDLPEPLQRAERRRIEVSEPGASILASTGADRAWERWRFDGETWTRHPLGLGAEFDVTPAGGPTFAALVERADHPRDGGAAANADAPQRRIVYLPDDGPIPLAELDDSIPDGTALAWFRGAPVLIDGSTGTPRLRRVDPVTGEIGDPVELAPQRSLAAAWSHLPVLGAIVISLLMIVFFARSLRDEAASRLPEGWEPMPFPVRLAALGIDLIPGIVATKFLLGVPWTSFFVMPWLVIDADAALPMIVAPIVTVIITTITEAAIGTSIGKKVLGGRVVSMRVSAATIEPTFGQTIARNVFKSVVLQMQLLAIFTLIHPLGQGVGETVSMTAVVRRRPAVTVPTPG